MPKPTRKPVVPILQPVAVAEARVEEVRGGGHHLNQYNPKELGIDKYLPQR